MHSLRHLVHVGCEFFPSRAKWAAIMISMNTHFEAAPQVMNNDRSLFMEIIIVAHLAPEEKISQPTQYLTRSPLRPLIMTGLILKNGVHSDH